MLRVVVMLTRLSMVENLSSSDLSEAKKVKGGLKIVQVVGMGDSRLPNSTTHAWYRQSSGLSGSVRHTLSSGPPRRKSDKWEESGFPI